MGRAPCCDKDGLKKGPWTPEEDQKLTDYIQQHGHGSWRTLPKHAGLLRCGKSCRLRWTNYLRPDIKRGKFSFEEEQTIIQLHGVLGNKWSAIASHLPGRTDNEIKNYWNTHLKKRLLQMGIDPVTHRPRIDLFNFSNMSQLLAPASLSHMAAQWERARLEAVTTDYLRVLAAYRSAAMIQQASQTQTQSATMDADHLMSYLRNQLGDAAVWNMPDTMNSAMAQANWALNSENLGSSDSNALATQIIMEQLQVPAAQIMQNLQSQMQNNAELSAPLNGTSMTQHSSPSSTLSSLDGFHTLKAEQLNNISHRNNVPSSHDSAKISNQALLQDQGYQNLMNASAALVQQQSRSQDNNSPSTDQLVTSPILWPDQEEFFGISKNSNSESVPALVSTTSSPNIFNDSSDMFHDASSIQNSQNCMTSESMSTHGYGLPQDLFLDFSLQTTKQQNVETMAAPATSTTHMISGSSSWSEIQNSHEDGGDYWSNMLKYVGESSNNNLAL